MRRGRVVLLAGLIIAAVGLQVRGRDMFRPRTAAAEAAATTQAIEFFETKLATDPMNALVATRLAERYMLRFQHAADLNDVRRAESLIAQSVPYVADQASLYANLSSVRLTRHDFAGAWTAAQTALTAEGRPEPAWSATFDAALATGRYEVAARARAHLEPGSAAELLRRAHWLDVHGDADAAFAAHAEVCEQLERSAVRAVTQAWCLVELAGIEQGRAGPEAAEALLRRALRVLPGYRGAIEALADAAHASHDWRRAIRLYAAIAVDAHPDLYLRLAEAERALGRVHEAGRWERAFLRVAAAPEAEPLYAHPLALYWAERPDTRTQALQVALRDVERRPAVESWDVLAHVYYRAGDFTAALEASDRAVSFGAASPTILYRRARILAAVGRQAEAAALLQDALARPDLLEPEARLDLARSGAG